MLGANNFFRLTRSRRVAMMIPEQGNNGKAMKRLEGRVAIVTGAGRGIGRAYALELAAEGAAVVVNDVGLDPFGHGTDIGPAEDVAAEIRSKGGRATANSGDVTDWNGAKTIVDAAIAAFGDLHILVNNAGVLLHHTILTATEEDWDKTVDINLKGDMAMTKWAMLHWVEQAKKNGQPVKASIVHTTSIGAMANFGNPSYSASKAGVANLGLVAALEGASHGIRSNVISPGGRTRLTLTLQGEERMNRKIGGFDFSDPANIAPLIVYLAMEDCPVTGAVFHASGNQIGLFRQWPFAGTREKNGKWTVEALQEMLPEFLGGNFDRPSVSTTLESYGEIAARARAALTQP